MAEFKKENRFLVIKQEDIRNFLTPKQNEILAELCYIIDCRRKEQGKKQNSYAVVNEDEPYADVIWKLIEVSQTNPEGLPVLLENLKVEFYGFG